MMMSAGASDPIDQIIQPVHRTAAATAPSLNDVFEFNVMSRFHGASSGQI
jgi:hypothetical protein